MTRRTARPRALVVGLILTGVAVLVPTSAQAVPGLTTVSATSAYDSTSSRFVSAHCPNGTVVLGGGADIIDGGSSARLVQSNGAATATCPSGRKVIGAGGGAWGQEANDNHIVLDTIRAMPGLTEVKTEAFQLDVADPHASDVSAVAVCANPHALSLGSVALTMASS